MHSGSDFTFVGLSGQDKDSSSPNSCPTDIDDLGSGVASVGEIVALLKKNGRATSTANDQYGIDAVVAGVRAGLFRTIHTNQHTTFTPARPSVDNDRVALNRWQYEMGKPLQSPIIPRKPHAFDTGNTPLSTAEAIPSVASKTSTHAILQTSLSPLHADSLTPDQRRAFYIVQSHLLDNLAGKDPPQLLLMVQGEAGTGKSLFVQSITELYTEHGARNKLSKAAYTGIAASGIDGKTVHKIVRFGIFKNTQPSKYSMRILVHSWKSIEYLIIDEYSMIACDFFARLAKTIALARATAHPHKKGLPFGGLNVIIVGDPHQFPPVACSRISPLYYKNNSSKKPEECDFVFGRQLYEKFTTVVKLTKQVRVTDPTWRQFLSRLRVGRVCADDLRMLRSLLLQPSSAHSFWSDAVLVTPRHTARNAWNTAALWQHCSTSKQQMYEFPAFDTLNNARTLNRTESDVVARYDDSHSWRSSTSQLPALVQLAVGAKVIVTLNLDTDIDIVNGARGTVHSIVLHKDEQVDPTLPVVRTKRPPAYILVKLDRTRLPLLHGLPQGVVPIVPAQRSFTISVPVPPTGVPYRRNRAPSYRAVEITRCQLPITLAYAFTDYRAQGQTIPKVIVDIASPPGRSKLSLFNLYVALSRSSGRDTIRLLRDFDDNLFTQTHDAELLKDDERTDRLDRVTFTSQLFRTLSEVAL